AAARPNALPPVSRTASTCWTSVPGRRRSVSRVPGAPPRTSPEPIVPGGQSSTVHPVSAIGSVQCPTRIPGTRVITEPPCSRLRPFPAAGNRLAKEGGHDLVELGVALQHRGVSGTRDHG